MENNLLQYTVTNFADRYYYEYSMYTIEQRAIPSYIDGMKPVQRKLLYSAIKYPKNKEIKVAELGASISSCDYHHGETSAQNACVLMAAHYNNNVPLFVPEGNFGTRLVPEASSPRYIFVKLSDNYYNIFMDNEVCDYVEEYEPIHYLPLIPFSLLNGIKGVAVGFATNILPRKADDLRKACIEYLSKNKIKTEISVKYPSYRGKIEYESDKNRYVFTGIYDVKVKGKKYIYHITELPIKHTRESYFNFLVELCDQKLIIDFEEDCRDTFDFTVTVNEEQNAQIDKNVNKFFDLVSYETENLTTLDETGRLIIFEDVYQLVARFCEYRLEKTNRWLQYKIKEKQYEYKALMLKMEYVLDVVNGKIDFRNYDKKSLLKYLMDKNISDEKACEDAIGIQSYNFTKDYVEKLKNMCENTKNDLEVLSVTTAKDLYIERLRKMKFDETV